jgi:hypothetical protein
MRGGIYKNPYLSTQYKIIAAQRDQRQYLYKEVLSLLAMLYASQIESGYRRIEDFGAMTGVSFNREMLFRKLILDGRIAAKKETRKVEQKMRENELLEALKKSQK